MMLFSIAIATTHVSGQPVENPFFGAWKLKVSIGSFAEYFIFLSDEMLTGEKRFEFVGRDEQGEFIFSGRGT
jgi:hypothetical protein